ncbi:MAG TPA: glycosyltransferase [Anaerolineaceae bacterium]|nr:glycosyltransferase [Anaerolineaceae bacterium]
MKVRRVAFFTYNQIESALELYRFISPLKAAGIEIVPGVAAGDPNLDIIAGADLVCFQRDFSRRFKAYQSVLTEARARGVPVVMDLDDHLLALPPDHPDRLAGDYADSLSALLHALLSADALTVTTPELKRELLPFNPHVFVLPNYLDADLWQFRPADRPVRILFMGTPTHAPDLEGIAEALRNIARRYGSRVRFVFFGARPPEGLADLARVDYQPVRSYDYRQFQQEFLRIEADIALAPLQDNVFNRCKSAIKFLEYSALGLAGVYAALPSFAAVVRDGENSFLAEDAQSWESKLGALIEDPALCLRMAARAQEDIRRQWLTQDHAQEWQQVYGEIARVGAKTPESANPIESALAAAALQLEELRGLTNSRYSRLHEDLAKQHAEILLRDKQLEAQRKELQSINLQLESLQTALVGKEIQLEALRDEVVGYANSRSWKLTRPLRAFNRLLGRLLKK